MEPLRFEWDPAKERANRQKHGVSFEEARTVFFDEFAVQFYDDDHAEWEDRFLLLVMSAHLRLLLVCHCHRSSGSVLRIISARKASPSESVHYRRD